MKKVAILLWLVAVGAFAAEVPVVSFRKDCEDKIYTPRFCGDVVFFTATGCNAICSSAFQDAKKLDDKYRELMDAECKSRGGSVRWEISQPEPGPNKCGNIPSMVKAHHWHKLVGKGKCTCQSEES